MTIYNINLIIVYISSFISRIFKENRKTIIGTYIFIGITFISMFIISGFRYNVGTDYKTYENIFKTIQDTDTKESTIEIGYYILNKIVYNFNSSPQTIFIVTSFIILVPIFITILKYSTRYELSIYLFITLFSFYASLNVIRQYIAISFTFYAVKYIFEKNFKRYSFWVLLAATFHSTSIIMLLAYFIANIDMDIKKYIYGIFMCIIGFIGFEKIFYIIMDIFPRYTQYKESNLFSYGSTTGVIVYGAIFIIMYIYKEKLIDLDERNKIYINFTFIAFLISILTIKGVLFSRVAGFFNIYSIILIPNLLDIFKEKDKNLIYYIILCVGYAYCYLLLCSNQGEVLPYNFRVI